MKFSIIEGLLIEASTLEKAGLFYEAHSKYLEAQNECISGLRGDQTHTKGIIYDLPKWHEIEVKVKIKKLNSILKPH